MLELHGTAGRTGAFKASRVAPGPWRALTLPARSRLKVSAGQRRFLQQPTILGCQGDCRRGERISIGYSGCLFAAYHM